MKKIFLAFSLLLLAGMSVFAQTKQVVPAKKLMAALEKNKDTSALIQSSVNVTLASAVEIHVQELENSKLIKISQLKDTDACSFANISERIQHSGKKVLDVTFRLKEIVSKKEVVYEIYSIDGIESNSDYLLRLEREANKEKNLGYITNSEVESQRKTNTEKGLGNITDVEVESQKKANAEKGLGSITDTEVESQKKANTGKGLGNITDFEAESQRKANAKKGLGNITDQEVANIDKMTDSLIKEGEAFEKKNKFCYALGKYYEASAIESKAKIKSKGTEKYDELVKLILSGNPGRGTFSPFQILDAWKALLIDTEKYGTEYGAFEFEFGELKQDTLDYKAKTATYKAVVIMKKSGRYSNVIKKVYDGFEKAYRDDWEKDLMRVYDGGSGYMVERECVSARGSNALLVNGVAVFSNEEDLSYGKRCAFEHVIDGACSLYDLKMSLVDKNGKEIADGNRSLMMNLESVRNGFYYGYYYLNNVPEKLMTKIESGEAKLNFKGAYLQYGSYNPYRDPFYGTGKRDWIKNLKEVQIPANKIDYTYSDVNDDNKYNR